ncbi:MAG: PEGA domain-containing protein [Myxococcota bacterium]
MTAVTLALLPPLLLAAPPPTSRRVAALLVPMDQGAEAHLVRLEGYMVEALRDYRGFAVKPTDELFGMPVSNDAQASLQRAEKGFGESRLAFEKRDLPDAERKLRATLKEFGGAAHAMTDCGRLCDALAMYAAVLHERGDPEEARFTLLDLQALHPHYELDKKRFTQDFVAFRHQVASSQSANLRGNVQVKSRPAGARVYLNGAFQGFTPVSLQTLPMGKHLLRIDRPGFQQVGELLEVSADDRELFVDLKPTPEYRAFDALLDKLAAEVVKDKGGTTMASLGKSLGLDRALVGVLKEINESGGIELFLGYYDLPTGRKLAMRKIVFQGDEYGQLKSEVGRLVNYLVNNAEGQADKVRRSSDPLDRQTGMEDWSAEDRGGARTGKEKKKRRSGDPLEGVSGTEDW